jgi:hypothetical protein
MDAVDARECVSGAVVVTGDVRMAAGGGCDFRAALGGENSSWSAMCTSNGFVTSSRSLNKPSGPTP